MIDREYSELQLNPLSANATKWSYTIKQFVGKLPTNCLSVTILWGWCLKGYEKYYTLANLGFTLET